MVVQRAGQSKRKTLLLLTIDGTGAAIRETA